MGRALKEIRQDLKIKIDAFNKGIEGVTEKETALEEIRVLTVELEQAEQIERAAQKLAGDIIGDLEKKEGVRFSLTKFIRESIDGKFTGVEAEVERLGEEEMLRNGLAVQGHAIPTSVLRAMTGQNVTTPGDGGNLAVTAPIQYIEALKKELVLVGMGATFLGDLVGEIPVVTGSNITGSWGPEGKKDETTQKAAYAKAKMTPKRCFLTTSFSKDLVRQTSVDVENLLLKLMIEAHAQLIEQAAINGTGTDNQPRGILNTTGIGAVAGDTNGAKINWPNVVKLETAVDSNDATGLKMGYLTNSKVIGAMKTTEMASGTARYLLDPLSKELNGYQCKRSNNVPSNFTKGTADSECSAMIFGDFSKLWIGQWGGLDIVVDPFTKKTSAEIEITINAWNDVLVTVPKAFAAIKDITIA